MNKQPVLNILKDIFHAYGYETDSSYISDLVASRGTTEHIYIKLDWDIDYQSIRTFVDSMKQTEGKGLYILNNTAPGDVLDFAARNDLIFWNKYDLEKQIGKAILCNAQGLSMELNLSTNATDKPFNVPEPPDVEEKQDDSIFDMFNTSASSEPKPEPEQDFKIPGLDTNGNTGRETDYQTDAIEKETIIRIQLPSMPINMPKTSALKIGQAKIGDIKDFVLKFIPYYSYAYDFETKTKIRSKVIDLNGQGEGIINAITSENSFTRFPQHLEHMEVPTENYQIKEPHITDKDALKIARDAIIEKHSEKMKLDEVKGDAIIYESKTISPVEKDINITIRLVYIPVWEVQGLSNTIDINAYDGHLLEEPVDDDAEFV